MRLELRREEPAGAPAFVLAPPAVRKRVLVLHGYGGSKEELLGIGATVAEAGFTALIPDLPGHGEHPSPLTWPVIRDFLAAFSRARNDPRNDLWGAVGHSLGGRLALALELPRTVVLSIPADARFEGRRTELLRTLRARRVREEKPYAGLVAVLDELPNSWPAQDVLLLHARRDLETCLRAARRGRELGWEVRSVTSTRHLDIVCSHEVFTTVKEWFLCRDLCEKQS